MLLLGFGLERGKLEAFEREAALLVLDGLVSERLQMHLLELATACAGR